MVQKSPEKRTETSINVPRQSLAVAQPKKLENLLETIDLINSVSEKIGEGRGGDMPATTGTATQATTEQSWRAQAIANLPTEPSMRKELVRHIGQEISHLQREVRAQARRAGRPGAAYRLTELYARIRRLNGLLADIIETSVDVIRRLYVRIFIDKQPVL
jgi:hypothetical protein